MSIKQAQLLFYSAAFFNWLAAVLLFAPLRLGEQIGVHPPPVGGPYEGIMTAAIAVFGVGYFWVARIPGENLSLVKLGLLGKVAVVAVVCVYGLLGEANATLMVLVLGDVIYAMLFALYLKNINNMRYAA